ncbi:MAG: hypothetical protein R2849_10190 [Thermomicrobiales bacterium]
MPGARSARSRVDGRAVERSQDVGQVVGCHEEWDVQLAQSSIDLFQAVQHELIVLPDPVLHRRVEPEDDEQRQLGPAHRAGRPAARDCRRPSGRGT